MPTVEPEEQPSKFIETSCALQDSFYEAALCHLEMSFSTANPFMNDLHREHPLLVASTILITFVSAIYFIFYIIEI